MIITGKVYSPNDSDGRPAIRIGEAGTGWSLVLVITPPAPMFANLAREDHIFAGEIMVHEAKDVDNIPSQAEFDDLRHMVYVENPT